MKKDFKKAALAICLIPLLGGCDLVDKDRGWKNDARVVVVYGQGNAYPSTFTDGTYGEIWYKEFVNHDTDYYLIEVKCFYEVEQTAKTYRFVKCPYEIEYKEVGYGSLSQNQA